MKLVLCFVLIISLCGCAVNTTPTECVADEYIVDNAPSYFITADYPAEAVLTASCQDGCCAVFTHPDYEITQEIFEAENLSDALLRLTGRKSDELTVIRVASTPREEYRFRWIAAGENGTQAFSAKLLYDGEYCYSIIAHCPIDKLMQYESVFSDLFACTTLEAV